MKLCRVVVKIFIGLVMFRRLNLGCSIISMLMGLFDIVEVLFVFIVMVLGEGVCFEGRKRSCVGVEMDNWIGRIKLMSLLR